MISAYTLVTHVKFCRLVFASYEDDMSRSIAFQTTLAGQPPDKQTRKTCTWRHSTNNRGSYPLAYMETSDNTPDQVHSIFGR